MATPFRCPTCGHEFPVTVDQASVEVLCPACLGITTLPASTTTESALEMQDASVVDNPSAGTFNPYAAPQTAALPSSNTPSPFRRMARHRGSQVRSAGIASLALGGAALLICPLGLGIAAICSGFIAIARGIPDLSRMSSGTIDHRGRGATLTGVITGVVGLLLGVMAIALNMLVAQYLFNRLR